LEYQVLGPLQVVRSDGIQVHLARRERELVAVLLVFAGDPCTRDMLVHALWGGSPPASPAGALQTSLCRARSALGPGSCLRTLDDGALCAEPGPEDLDLTRFWQLRTAGMRHLEHGHLRPAGQALQHALACWRNPPLPDLPDAPEVAAQRTRLLKERELAWLTLADILLALGEHDRLLPDLHARVVTDPLCERSWAQLMLALHQSGRSGEALAAYSKARAEIVRALGTEPGAELQHLRDLVLSGQAAIVPVLWPSAGLAAAMPAPLATRGSGR